MYRACVEYEVYTKFNHGILYAVFLYVTSFSFFFSLCHAHKIGLNPV